MSWVAARNALCTSSSEMESGSSKYFSSRFSSYSATASMSSPRNFSASSLRSLGISISSKVDPKLSSCQTIARFFTKSTIPLKSSSSPMFNTIGTALDLSMSRTCWQTPKKFDPWRSILLTKPIRGTL